MDGESLRAGGGCESGGARAMGGRPESSGARAMGDRGQSGSSSALFDRIGRSYTASRRGDPRIAAAVWEALGRARTVLNVGAGAGAYEPPDREVVAVEPSEVMISQRPPGTAPVVRAVAESLPFADESFDAVMALFTDHHWRDRRRGLSESRRVARDRVLLLNINPAEQRDRFWLTTEYLPGALGLIEERYLRPGVWEAELRELLGELTLIPVPIPHDCRDGFYGAFWRRPHAYLDPAVRANISVFSRLPAEEVAAGLERLRRDLESGAWERRHADLLEREELDLGCYVILARRGPRWRPSHSRV